MSRLHRNFLNGTITNNPLASGGTSITSTGFVDLPAIVTPDVIRLVLDPNAVNGAPEIVEVTAHSASSTTVTVTRQAESSTTNPARAHPSGTQWIHGPTADDLSSGTNIPWTPTLKQTTTNPSGASVSGYYTQVGGWVLGYLYITFSGWTPGSGSLYVDAPVSSTIPYLSTIGAPVGWGYLRSASTTAPGLYVMGGAGGSSVSRLLFHVADGALAAITEADIASTTQLAVKFEYPVA